MATVTSPLESVDEGSIRVGYTRRGRRASLELAFLDNRGVTGIGSDGTIREITRSTFDRMVSVDGATTVRSLCAALLIAAPLAYGKLDGGAMDLAIVGRTVTGRLPTARRAAAELARVGAITRIDVLPVANGERTWWKATGYLRLGDVNAAIDQFAQLPPDGYNAATGLIFRCAKGADAQHLTVAEELIRLRLSTSGRSDVTAAAEAADVDPSPWAWLADPALPLSEAEDDRFPLASVSLLRFLLRGKSERKPLNVPPGTPLAVIDDAIELGAVVTSESLSGLPKSDAIYLRARTEPEQLTAEDVTVLDFDTERRRRLLADSASSSPDNSQATQDADDYLAGLAAMAQGQPPNGAVRQSHPELSAAFERFLRSPDEASLVDRITIDPSLWPPLSKHLGDDAAGWNPPRGSASRQFLAWHSLGVAVEHLMEAQWQSAQQAAKHALRLSDEEATNDESLNVMACVHWQLGNDEAAQQALTTALEGNRNPSLQVNLGVVAGGLDPEAAALEFARLVRESESIDLRTAAALRAVGLWLTDDVPWVSEQEHGMPEPLALALRTLVVEPIGIESFKQIAKLQSSYDAEWLAGPGSLTGSPHVASLEARIYQARASGADTFVDVLTEVLGKGKPAVWVVEERDALLAMIVRHAIEDELSGAGLFAFLAIEKGLPIEPEQRDMLIPLAVHGVCGMISTEDEAAAPNDRFTKLLADGERDARRRGTYDHLDELYVGAWNRLGALHALNSRALLVQAAEAFDRVMGQIGHVPRRRLNMAIVRQSLAPIREAAREIETTMRAFQNHVEDDEIREFVNDLHSNARLLATETEKITR